MKGRLKILRTVLPDAIQSTRKRARRTVVRLRLKLSGADKEARLQAERMLRGREQYGALRKADAVVVSHPKCGRTWLRVMLSSLYQQVYDLPEDVLLGFDNFHHMDRHIPRILFTHDDFIREYTGNRETKADFYDKKVILLVRDPRDVAVSQFFHWLHRTQPWKKDMYGYPKHDNDLSVFEFVLHEDGGLPRVINFMNMWARDRENLRNLLVVRYEDMRAAPFDALAEVSRFLDIPATDLQLEAAVAYASYENMKKKEAEQSFRMSGSRLAPGNKDNPDSFKVRRAKVGGYRDYFDNRQIEAIDALVSDTLDPIFGYFGTAPQATSERGANGVTGAGGKRS